MGERTGIEWTDATWSPWEGCTKVSPGCDHCYAEGMNRWLRKGENWGPGAPRRQYSDEHWEKPLRWNAKARDGMRVFPSVCDPFDNEVPVEWRMKFFDLITDTPNLTWLLLTKRIGNAARMIEECAQRHAVLPMHNVWLGATVVNQEEADRDLDKLLRVPAAVHFVSYEPALGPVTIARWLGPQCDNGSVPGPGGAGGVACPRCGGQSGHCHGLSWVIAGGESGRGARPAHPDWFRAVRDDCENHGTPFLFKQWGEWIPMMGHAEGVPVRGEKFKHGDGTYMGWAGKAAAGRLLDGVEHNGFPEVAG